MKKQFNLLLITFIMVCITPLAFSQGHFGVKGGVNLSNLAMDDELNDNLLGYQAGLVYFSSLEKALFVQSGILYNIKGTKYSESGTDVSLKYDFVEVPLNLGVKIPLGQTFAISPFVGAFAGYAIKGTAKFGGLSVDIFDNDLIDDQTEKPKRIDYGANAGLNLHLGKRILVSGQYSYGLANLGDSEYKAQTRTATVGLNLLF